MKKLLFISFLFITVFAKAIEIDSAKYEQFVNRGSLEFCRILDINEEALFENKKENMQFVIELPGNYVSSVAYGEHYGQTFTDQTIKDSLNARIRRVYLQYGVEMYIVLINSLDVIINTPLPANTTSDAFFKSKLYDENSNIASLKALHNSITDRIISQSLTESNRDCIVYSQAEYCGSFFSSGKKGCWEFTMLSHHNGAISSYSSLGPLQDYFETRILSNHDALSGGINGQLVTTVNEFVESAKYINLKEQIRHTYTVAQLDDIFSKFNEEIDYEHLSESDRIHAISVYTGYAMAGGWFGNQETYAIRLIDYTPKEQVHSLLYDLQQPNQLKNNPAYHGDPFDDALVKKLIDHTNDAAMFGEDNYTKLVQVFIKLICSSDEIFNEHLPTTAEGWQNSRIFWDDSYLFSNPPIGTHSYDVTLNNNGTVTYSQQIVDRFDADYNNAATIANYTPHWDANYTPVELKPFDLVYFTNRSTLGMLRQAGAKKSNVLIAPAIFLKYADDKSFNNNSIRVSAIALDVVACATGPGLIMGAVEAGEIGIAAFEAFQFLGSASNLVANGITDPKLHSLIDDFNSIVAVWGITRIATSGLKYTVNYFTEASASQLKVIPVAQAETYLTHYNEAEEVLGQLDVGTKEEVKKMKQYLEGKVPPGGEIASLLTRRESWLNYLKSQYGPLNISNFKPQGLEKTVIPNELYNEMISEYSSSLSLIEKEKYCDALIKSGSSIPLKINYPVGSELYKIVPKDAGVSAFTPFFCTKSELGLLELSEGIEQKVGLPLQSHAIEYDVYVITSNQPATAFESVIAPTIENGYHTTGGSKQILVIDRSKWNPAIKVKTITPEL